MQHLESIAKISVQEEIDQEFTSRVANGNPHGHEVNTWWQHSVLQPSMDEFMDLNTAPGHPGEEIDQANDKVADIGIRPGVELGDLFPVTRVLFVFLGENIAIGDGDGHDWWSNDKHS